MEELEEELSYRFDTYGVPEAPAKVREIPDKEEVGSEETEEGKEDKNEPGKATTTGAVVPLSKALTGSAKLKSNKVLDLKPDPKDREIRIFISSPFK